MIVMVLALMLAYLVMLVWFVREMVRSHNKWQRRERAWRLRDLERWYDRTYFDEG